MSWNLPARAEIGGGLYDVATDYRDIFDIIKYLQSDEDEETKSLTALNLFYEDFDSIPPEHYQEAVDYLSDFINCFERLDAKQKPRLIDWDQDRNMIAAEVNKVAGLEVRSLPYLHWFTFIGYFYAIGEGQLSTICSIRKKKRTGKKLEKWEQEFYRENKEKIDFHQDDEAVCGQSEAAKEFWAAFFGEEVKHGG